MIRRLRGAANEAEDVLLVYYAGHGLLGWNGDLHLAVGETNPDQVAGTAVPFEWVKQTIEESPARTRILILDCCFSGRAVGAMSGDDAALMQIDVRGAFVLTSTTANRVSHAVPGERNTAFTAELVQILSRGVESPYATLRLRDVYRPLKAALARRGLPEPKVDMRDASGDLVLRRPRPQEAAPAQSTPAEPLSAPIVPAAAASTTFTPMTFLRAPEDDVEVSDSISVSGRVRIAPQSRSADDTNVLPVIREPLFAAPMVAPQRTVYIPSARPEKIWSPAIFRATVATGRGLHRASRVAWSVLLWVLVVSDAVFVAAGISVTVDEPSIAEVVGAIIMTVIFIAIEFGFVILIRRDLRQYAAARRARVDPLTVPQVAVGAEPQ
jgi:hypothetical protein